MGGRPWAAFSWLRPEGECALGRCRGDDKILMRQSDGTSEQRCVDIDALVRDTEVTLYSGVPHVPKSDCDAALCNILHLLHQLNLERAGEGDLGWSGIRQVGRFCRWPIWCAVGGVT